MLKMLNHKNIVKIYNCFTLKNMKVAFIMDYLEGGDLLEYLESIFRPKNYL
jgi:serine/threonine protein kinase